ncbi:PQQ-binding-like beta-propeller repeat protein [Planctomycetota bacterium]
MKQRIAALCLVVLVVSIGVGAEQWSGFRGPDARGQSAQADVVTSWSETENLVWKVPLPGPGSSSPIVWQDRVFVTCYSGYGLDKESPGDPNALKRHLVCVDASSGKVLWDRSVPAVLPELPWRSRFQEHGYASQTPATDGERVYVFFGKTGVLAFNMTGKQLWQQSVGTGSDTKKWGSAASVTLTQDLVIVNAWDESKTLYALNKSDGQPKWQVDLSATDLSFATPILATLEDGRQEIIMALPLQIWGLDPQTGTKRWWIDTGIKGMVSCSPVVVNGIAYVHSGGQDGRSSLAVRCGGQGDVTETHILWSNTSDASSVTSPVHAAGHLYWVSSDGQTFCQDANTGKLKYKDKLPVKNRFAVYASLVNIGDHLLAVTRHDGTFILAAQPEFVIEGNNKFNSDTSDFSGSPAVSGGHLFLRSFSHLYCLGK